MRSGISLVYCKLICVSMRSKSRVRIEERFLSTLAFLTRLQLTNQNLRVRPNVLASNKLSFLPSEFENLSVLQDLNFGKFELGKRTSWGFCTYQFFEIFLHPILHSGKNNITSIPQLIWNLSSLESLALGKNSGKFNFRNYITMLLITAVFIYSYVMACQ